MPENSIFNTLILLKIDWQKHTCTLVAIPCQFCLLLVDKEGCACHRNGFLVWVLIIDAFLKQVYMQQCM